MNANCPYFIFTVSYIQDTYCTFETGDITGGTEKEIGRRGKLFKNIADTDQDCAKLVLEDNSDATGATYQPSNKRCWGEYGSKKISSDAASYRTCVFDGMAIIQTVSFILFLLFLT